MKPYELMKLRLLNASHQALCYFGYLAGYRLVHEVAQDPLFANFLLDYMNREATPTLAPVPGIDLDAYKLQLIERFSNAAVRDTVARLCAKSSDRIPMWLVPVIRENLAAGREVTLSAAVVASWARYAEGVDEQGEPIKRGRSTGRHTAADCRPAAGGPAGLRQEPRALRRSGHRAGVHRAVPGRAEFLAQPRRPRHARGPRHALLSRLDSPPGPSTQATFTWIPDGLLRLQPMQSACSLGTRRLQYVAATGGIRVIRRRIAGGREW